MATPFTVSSSSSSSSSAADLAMRLSQNDPGLRHLYLSSDSLSRDDVTRFTTALSHSQQHGKNTHLQHVYFRNFKLGGSLQSMERLLVAVQGLQNLQGLFFHCTEVPLGLLMSLLLLGNDAGNHNNDNNSGLVALGMRYCKLKYTNEEEYQAWEDALRHHSSLQDVCIECCEWQSMDDVNANAAGANVAAAAEEERQPNNNNNNNTHRNLDKTSSFLEAISHIPTLQHVECVLAASSSATTAAAAAAARRGNNHHNHHHHHHRQRLPATTLQGLCQIPSLTSLRLRNLWLPEEDVALLCQNLLPPPPLRNNNNHTYCRATSSSSSGLQKLILSCDLGPISAMALGQFLQDPRCVLEHLSLRVDHLEDPDCPQVLAHALAKQQRQRQTTTASAASAATATATTKYPSVPSTTFWSSSSSSEPTTTDNYHYNSTGRLQHFHLSGSAASQLSDAAKAAFREMMQINVALEFVRLEVSDYHLQGQIAFYLQLNHKGRRELFAGIQQQQQQAQQSSSSHRNERTTATTTNNNTIGIQDQRRPRPPRQRDDDYDDGDDGESSLWVRALCQNTSDVQALHYFLALHPGLFAMAALTSLQRQQRRHFLLLEQRQQQRQRQMELEVQCGIEYDPEGW